MTATNICKKYTSIYGLSNEAYLGYFIITPSSSFLVRRYSQARLIRSFNMNFLICTIDRQNEKLDLYYGKVGTCPEFRSEKWEEI